MKVSVLCSDPRHPVNAFLDRWARDKSAHHVIEIRRRKEDLSGGDILFLISCSEIITAQDRAKYRASLVIHASDLPRGRGWSPHVWEIVGGAEAVTLSLLEAEDKVDSGRIWKKLRVSVPDHALWDEIGDLLFAAEIELMEFAVDNIDVIEPREQSSAVEPTYYRRRRPEDSQLDPTRSIADQFDLIRVCDPERYPAFFDYRGYRYVLTLEKKG